MYRNMESGLKFGWIMAIENFKIFINLPLFILIHLFGYNKSIFKNVDINVTFFFINIVILWKKMGFNHGDFSLLM